LSRTLDHVGPLCRSADDAAILFDVLRGQAPMDLPPLRAASGVRLGILRDYFLSLLDPQVAASFERACDRLRAHGVTVDQVAIPHANDAAPVYLHIVLPEAAAYHAKTLDSRPDQYTPNVRLRLEMGRYILAEDYARAFRGREVLKQEVDTALDGYDALLLPALAIPAPKLGAASVKVGAAEEPVRNITLRLTQLFNLSGHPAITLPCGHTVEQLPTGAQLVGHHGRTRELLEVARSLEAYLDPRLSG
jgi:aspartyl-tRNA(Asn)/glutamyl-tRNA(Gln) amidotransferase subunit A